RLPRPPAVNEPEVPAMRSGKDFRYRGGLSVRLDGKDDAFVGPLHVRTLSVESRKSATPAFASFARRGRSYARVFPASLSRQRRASRASDRNGAVMRHDRDASIPATRAARESFRRISRAILA